PPPPGPAVRPPHQHVYPLATVHLHLLADDVRLDRQLATAAVDQHAQGDPLGPAEVRELVERGPHGAAGIQHIVYDYDVLAGQVAWNPGLADHGLRADGLEVVAVQRDGEGAAGNGYALVFPDQ